MLLFWGREAYLGFYVGKQKFQATTGGDAPGAVFAIAAVAIAVSSLPLLCSFSPLVLTALPSLFHPNPKFIQFEPVPNAQVCYFNNVWFMFQFIFKKIIFFIIYFYVFSVFIILLYNKNKVFLFHFCIFVYLDASLKFGERRHTSFFFKQGFCSLL